MRQAEAILVQAEVSSWNGSNDAEVAAAHRSVLHSAPRCAGT